MLVFSTFLHANSALSVVLPFPPKKFDKETTLKIDMVRTQWSQNLSKIAKNLENVNWHYKAIFFLLNNIIWQRLHDFLTCQLLFGPTFKLDLPTNSMSKKYEDDIRWIYLPKITVAIL